MPTVDAIVAMSAAGIALSASPGPSMFYVLSRAVGQSRAAGLASAIGLALGGMILALASALGAAAAINQFDPAIRAVELVGACYLAYLGACALRDAPKAAQAGITTVDELPLPEIVRQGVFVEMLNPKTILFLWAFVPQFVSDGGPNRTLEFVVLSLMVPLTAIPADICVSVLGGSIADRIRRRPSVAIALNVCSGLVLLGLALRILL